MKNHIRCVGCGRRHKTGHDNRIGKESQYNENCMDLKAGKVVILKQREEARIKAEAEVIKKKQEAQQLAEKEQAEKAKAEAVKAEAVKAEDKTEVKA